jgi:hypothetical protein
LTSNIYNIIITPLGAYYNNKFFFFKKILRCSEPPKRQKAGKISSQNAEKTLKFFRVCEKRQSLSRQSFPHP